MQAGPGRTVDELRVRHHPRITAPRHGEIGDSAIGLPPGDAPRQASLTDQGRAWGDEGRGGVNRASSPNPRPWRRLLTGQRRQSKGVRRRASLLPRFDRPAPPVGSFACPTSQPSCRTCSESWPTFRRAHVRRPRCTGSRASKAPHVRSSHRLGRSLEAGKDEPSAEALARREEHHGPVPHIDERRGHLRARREAAWCGGSKRVRVFVADWREGRCEGRGGGTASVGRKGYGRVIFGSGPHRATSPRAPAPLRDCAPEHLGDVSKSSAPCRARRRRRARRCRRRLKRALGKSVAAFFWSRRRDLSGPSARDGREVPRRLARSCGQPRELPPPRDPWRD